MRSTSDQGTSFPELSAAALPFPSDWIQTIPASWQLLLSFLLKNETFKNSLILALKLSFLLLLLCRSKIGTFKTQKQHENTLSQFAKYYSNIHKMKLILYKTLCYPQNVRWTVSRKSMVKFHSPSEMVVLFVVVSLVDFVSQVDFAASILRWGLRLLSRSLKAKIKHSFHFRFPASCYRKWRVVWSKTWKNTPFVVILVISALSPL